MSVVQQLKPCGTVAAYQRHLHYGETPCDSCRDAARAYKREWTRKYRSKPEALCRTQRCQNLAQEAGYCRGCESKRRGVERGWFLAEKIVDWLSIDGGWLTGPGIADDLGHHLDAVERVLRQLRERGLVESRAVRLAYAERSNSYDQRTEWRAL